MTNKILSYGAIIVAITAVVITLSVGNKEKVTEQVGSVTGPELQGNDWTVGGVRHFYNKVSVRTATTTPCSIKSPNATSSVVFAGHYFRRASDDGVTEFDVGIGTTAFATTSAGLMSTRIALATGPVQLSAFNGTTTYQVIAPNSFLVTKIATSSLSANFSLAGTCEAEFVTM